MAVEYTVPEDSPLLVAEAPKKASGRVIAAVAAALILGTAVTATTPSVLRAASNLATCGGLDCGKTTQIKLYTSEAGQWAPKQPMCISVEDRSKIVPPADFGGFPGATPEKMSAFLSKCYAASGGLKANHLPFPEGDYEGEYENALAEKCMNPTFNLRLEKCIDGKGRQQFTQYTSWSSGRGSIEHELPGGQIFCCNVDRDTNSVYLGFCSSKMAFVPECVGCDYFDRFDLWFKNMKPEVTFMMMPYDSWGDGWQGTGPEDPCMGAIARTDEDGASLKAGKQYNAGSIRVVDCALPIVSPQYQLTQWLLV